MANKLLLRILVSARPGIQAGKLKMQDIVPSILNKLVEKLLIPVRELLLKMNS